MKKKSITIVDYGMGNLFSVRHAFEQCGSDVTVTSDPRLIENAQHLVLPGVGAFGNGMNEIAKRNLTEPIKKFAQSGRPFLGICLGMQMMMQQSEEYGVFEGFGFIEGAVRGVPSSGIDGKSHKIPHVGWNRLTAHGNLVDTIFRDINENTWAYFVHSFMVTPSNPTHILASCDYDGIMIPAAIRKDNLYGCQFHPEKSGAAGLNILNAFCYGEHILFNEQQ